MCPSCVESHAPLVVDSFVLLESQPKHHAAASLLFGQETVAHGGVIHKTGVLSNKTIIGH